MIFLLLLLWISSLPAVAQLIGGKDLIIYVDILISEVGDEEGQSGEHSNCCKDDN